MYMEGNRHETNPLSNLHSDPDRGTVCRHSGLLGIAGAALSPAGRHRPSLPRLRYGPGLAGVSAAGYIPGLCLPSHVLDCPGGGCFCSAGWEAVSQEASEPCRSHSDPAGPSAVLGHPSDRILSGNPVPVTARRNTQCIVRTAAIPWIPMLPSA